MRIENLGAIFYTYKFADGLQLPREGVPAWRRDSSRNGLSPVRPERRSQAHGVIQVKGREYVACRPGWDYPILTAVVEVCGNIGYNWFDLPA
jgi:hypothetical protein